MFSTSKNNDMDWIAKTHMNKEKKKIVMINRAPTRKS